MVRFDKFRVLMHKCYLFLDEIISHVSENRLDREQLVRFEPDKVYIVATFLAKSISNKQHSLDRVKDISIWRIFCSHCPVFPKFWMLFPYYSTPFTFTHTPNFRKHIRITYTVICTSISLLCISLYSLVFSLFRAGYTYEYVPYVFCIYFYIRMNM